MDSWILSVESLGLAWSLDCNLEEVLKQNSINKISYSKLNLNRWLWECIWFINSNVFWGGYKLF